MANVATIAGLGFGNANTGLAHAMGHSLGGLFKQPHGRGWPFSSLMSSSLPLTREATRPSRADGELARFAGLTGEQDSQHAGENWSITSAPSIINWAAGPHCRGGVERDIYWSTLEILCDYAEMDTQIVTAPRTPERVELEQLFLCAYDGAAVEFSACRRRTRLTPGPPHAEHSQPLAQL